MPLNDYPDLITGIARIDEQHDRILNVLERLQAAVAPPVDHAEVRSVLATFSVLLETHFRSEEALMERAGYPDWPGHMRAHREMLGKVERIVEGCQAEVLDAEGLHELMQTWIEHHVANEDKALARFLNAPTPLRDPTPGWGAAAFRPSGC
jgi:hemerythrin